ncbi:zinc ribbon domain-containing protein [Anaeromicropila herbilytica]|uniref:Zinc-ribbon domain-containing protein n=1 Tax=Anaeromicropila herbilytica TaxID=2785025 RepID=A0A7R7IEL7_9FIRM|nr:zinc ribbon domain-containing protein [Anaeromicropila herbilytica]BCN32838.1 hypothetical protein bsdtb5_41330 [Anaeromicropila herbilytica]
MEKISKERKITYYIGLGMIVIGFLLFISVFFEVASFMSDPFVNDPFSGGKLPSMLNGVIGFFIMIAGGIVMNIGAKGAAGSGIILDPEKQREDLKPFNEAKGEMINDVISNIDAVNHLTKNQEQKEIIKIKCRNCGSLNDEDAKFCKGCGKEI